MANKNLFEISKKSIFETLKKSPSLDCLLAWQETDLATLEYTTYFDHTFILRRMPKAIICTPVKIAFIYLSIVEARIPGLSQG